MTKTAIVILNWNGRQMLAQYLPSVLMYSKDKATVYVADNASTDDSLELLREHFPEVRTIRLDKNWGFAEGYNQALQQVEAEYYVIMNSDIEVTHHWLTPLIEFMDNHPEAAACQPKLLSMSNKERFEYAGASGGFIDRLGYPFCRGRVFDTVENDNGQYDTRKEVMWATGACMMIRSKDYHTVGGFDGRFFAHCEEIDLCWRLHLLGRKVFCIPDSYVYHVGGGTLPKGNPMKTYLNFRNNLTMLYKNLPAKDLKSVMRWRWLLDYVAAFQTLLVNRNVGDFRAIYRARRDFKRWRSEYAPVRQQLQATKTYQKAVRQPISILWQYYVKGRRTYTALPLTTQEHDTVKA